MKKHGKEGSRFGLLHLKKFFSVRFSTKVIDPYGRSDHSCGYENVARSFLQFENVARLVAVCLTACIVVRLKNYRKFTEQQNRIVFSFRLSLIKLWQIR